MHLGSVSSGIEAASVAFGPIGWKAAWFSEIDKFANAVLAHHYPDVPNLGDMITLPDRIANGEVEAPDALCGGTPCQAFSVAGLRKSLDDARGNLSLTFCEIANAIDTARQLNGQQPCIVLWENVPGVLNTKDNAFGCFLAGLAGEDDPLVAPGGKWSNAGAVFGPKRAVAWRVLDAQYFGVAQRRRRVFVVASARAGFDPAAVLFEFNGVRRDSAPSRQAGETVTPTIRAGAPNGGAGHGARSGDSKDELITVHAPEIARCIATREGSSQDWETTTMVAHSLRGEGFDASEDGTGRGTPLVPVAMRPDVTPKWQDDLAFTLTQPSPTGGGQPQAVFHPIAFDTTQITSAVNRSNPQPGDPCHPLAAGAHAPTIAFHPTQDPISSEDGTTHCMGTGSSQGNATIAVAVQAMRESGQGYWMQDDIAGTLRAEGEDRPSRPSHVIQQTAMQVRRLTPTECERLQGFPVGYTAIPWRGKTADQCPDGPRYKALGNSWAVPNVRWIGERINRHLIGIL